MKKARELQRQVWDLEKQIKERCLAYINKCLDEHDNHIDLTECDDSVCVTYDGGNHPEYASNAFSRVYAVYRLKNNIYLETMDCDAYSLDDINADEIYGLADFMEENEDEWK